MKQKHRRGWLVLPVLALAAPSWGAGPDAVPLRLGDLFSKKAFYAEFRDSNFVTAVAADRDIVWFGTNNGLKLFDKRTGKWALLSSLDGLPSSKITDIALAGEQVWLATDRGVVRLNRKTGEMRTFSAADGLKQDSILVLETDSEDLWVAYGRWNMDLRGGYREGNAVVSRLQLATGKVRHYDVLASTAFPNQRSMEVFRLLSDRNDLWIVHGDCVTRLNKRTGAREFFNAGNVAGLKDMDFRTASSVMADKDGVWFSGGSLYSRGGLLRFDRKTRQWEAKNDKFTFPMTRQGDLIWVGSSYDVQGASEFVVKYLKDPRGDWKDAMFFKNGFMTAMAADKGGLWIGTTASIMRLDSAAKKVMVFTAEPRFDSLEAGRYTRLRVAGNSVFLHQGRDLGLYDVSSRMLSWLTEKEPASGYYYGPDTKEVAEGSRKDLWLSLADSHYDEGTTLSIARLVKGKTGKYAAEPIEVPDHMKVAGRAVEGMIHGYRLADDGKRLWVGLSEKEPEPRVLESVQAEPRDGGAMCGLARYDYRAGKWDRFEAGKSGFETDCVTGIALLKGKTWVATKAGLFSFSGGKWKKERKEPVQALAAGAKALVVITDKDLWLLQDGWRKLAYPEGFKADVFNLRLFPSGDVALLAGDSYPLFLYDSSAKTWARLEGLGARDIGQDASGRFWGTSDKTGLFTISLKEGKPVVSPAPLAITFKRKEVPLEKQGTNIEGERWN